MSQYVEELHLEKKMCYSLNRAVAVINELVSHNRFKTYPMDCTDSTRLMSSIHCDASEAAVKSAI